MSSRALKNAKQSWLNRLMLDPAINLNVRTTAPRHTTPDHERIMGSKISLTQTFPIPVHTEKRQGRIIKVSAEQMAAITNRQIGGSRSRYKKF